MQDPTYSAALWVLKIFGGYVLRFLQDFLTKVKPLALLLGDARNNKSDCFILLGSYDTVTPGFLAHTFQGLITINGPQQNMEIGAALAFSYVRAVLAAAGKTEGILTQPAYQNPGAVVAENNIAISGPGSNYRVGQVFATYPRTFFKIVGNNNVIQSDDGALQIQNTQHHDHGVLLKLQNQNNPEKVVFVIAGLGEEATAGSGFALWRFRHELLRKFGARPFGCVIKVDVRQGYQSAQIVDYSPRLRWYQQFWRWLLSRVMK